LECGKNCKPRTIFLLMDLPIDQKDLKIIVNALSLGGDARLYHKLKGIKEEYELEGSILNENYSECDI